VRAIRTLRAQRVFFAAARPLKLTVSCLGETLSLSTYESVADELERQIAEIEQKSRPARAA